MVVNGAGTVLWRDLYLPYGDVRYTWRNTATLALQTSYRYTGQHMEVGVGAPGPVGGLDRGLYDYGARWYDPSLGRFLQPDSIVPEPSNPQSFNRYAYARNSPLVRVDPSGHQDCKADDAACLFGSPYNNPNKSKSDGLAQKLQAQHTRRNTPGWLKDVLPSFSLGAPSLTQWGYVSPQQGFKITITLGAKGLAGPRTGR